MTTITLRYKSLSNGKFSLYLDYTLDGVRNYEFLRIHVSKSYSDTKRIADTDKQAMALAESIRAKRQYEIYNSSGFDTAAKQVNCYLFEYVEQYQSQTKRKNYLCLLKHLKIFSKKSPLLSEINPRWVNTFMAHLHKQVDINSVCAYMSALRMFVNKAYREKLISENPFDRIKMPKYVQRTRSYLTLDELKQLDKNRCLDNEQVEQAFLLSCFTGLRFSDIAKLKESDIQIEKDKEGKANQVLIIQPKKTANTSGRLLKIPLSEQALKIIKEIKRCPRFRDFNRTRGTARIKSKAGLLFDNLYNNAACNRLLKIWAKHAGIDKKVHFHVSRHSFATLSLSSGIEIYTVSKLLGHCNIMLTETYTALTEDKQSEEIKKFPQFKNL